MKKYINKIFIILLFLLFSGCKTPPVQNQITKVDKKINATMKIESNKTLKIYFPTFTFYNENTNKSEVVSGDGILIILPDNKTVLLDSFDTPGKKALVSFLNNLGIDKIDYLIASHYHVDHIGGMEAIIDNFDIGSFYSNGAPFDSDVWHSLEEKLEENNIQNNVLKQGDFLTLSTEPDTCYIDILWPALSEEDLYNLYYNPGKTQKLKNNSSLTFKLFYRDFSALFTGDIYFDTTRALRKKYKSYLKSTLLKLPHHGDVYTTNGLAFLNTVAPKVSVLQDNRYVGFILSTLCKMINTQLLYRADDGYILVETDGQNFNITQRAIEPIY